MNLFLIESPFQLINAIEAFNYYKSTNKNPVFLSLNIYGEKNRSQINKVVKEFNIVNYVISVDLEVKNKYDELKLLKKISLTIKKLVNNNGNINSIFIGDLRSYYFTLIINNLRTKAKIIALDDGNANIQIIKNLSKYKSGKNKWLKKMFYSIFGFSAQPLIPDEFFTYYFDLFTDVSDPKIRKNDFLLLKSKLSDKPQGDFCYFLGNKTPEAGILSYKNYYKRIERSISYINDKYNPSKSFYLPHRGENVEKIKLIEKKYGLEILETNMPFELFLIDSNEIPAAINSFFTSALDSAIRLLSNSCDINSFLVPPEEILIADEVDKISLNYNSYIKAGITIVDEY